MQRYNVSGIFDTEQDDNGELVLFVDAQAEIARLTAALEGALTKSASFEVEVERFREAIKMKGGTEHSPTEDAYTSACLAIAKHKARAEKAESDLATARAETAKWHADANLMLGFAELAYEAGAMPSSSELIAARDRALAADRKAVRLEGMREAARVKKDPAFGDDWLGMSCAILALADRAEKGGDA